MTRQISFRKSILKIALPVTIQSMLLASFSIIDQLMIGQLGSTCIAGVGLGGKFGSIFNVVLNAVTATAAILISQYMGQKNQKNVQRSFYLNLCISLALAALFGSISWFFTKNIMSCYTKDPATISIAVEYLQIYTLTFIPLAIARMAETMLCCMEAAVFPLIATLFSLICNTGLNYLLIFGKFGLPQLGVKGAAISTVVATCVACLLTICFLIARLHKKKQALHFAIKLSTTEQADYLKILLPLVITEFLWSLGENVYSGIYGNIGTNECAAMTMTVPIQGLMIGALCGLSKAAGIIIGKSLGSQDNEKAYDDSKKLLKYGLLCSLLLSVLLIVFAKYYAAIFHVSSDVKQIAYQLLLVFAVISPVKVQNMILGGGILQSGGKTKYILCVDLIGTWIFGVPLGLITAFVFHLPIVWVYFFLSLEECVRLAISFVLFRKKIWMKKIN